LSSAQIHYVKDCAKNDCSGEGEVALDPHFEHSVLEAEKKSRGIAAHEFLTSTLDEGSMSALYFCALDGINIVK
jgi:hypothetical protein